MKCISLFAGIGGFDLALTKLGHQIVYANEWDKYAANTYERNFNIRPDTRDIKTVKESEIPDHDLLVGGFPCQTFSIAGKRLGFNETRGTLFFDIARILKHKRPRYFILENVKGLLTHNSGETFQTILGVLTNLGYELQWQVLNSKNFGVPQNRERVFIIGNIRGTGRPKIFPIRATDKIHSKPHKAEEKIHSIASTLTARQFSSWNGNYLQEITKNKTQGYRVYNPKGISVTLAGETGGMGAKTGLYAIPVLTPDRGNKRQNGRRFKENGEPMFTLTAQDKHGIYDGIKIRKLTPTECERLQGFPDNWTAGVSDTQRYKQLGNAVTVNVVHEIVKRFYPQ